MRKSEMQDGDPYRLVDAVNLVQVLRERGARLASEEESRDVLDKAAKVLGLSDADRLKRWWWDRPGSRFFSVAYENNDLEAVAAGWAFLTRGEEQVYVTVTADYKPPWRTFAGPPQLIRAAIADAWLAEYFISPPSGEWVAFDTHHNCILMAGCRR